MLQNSRTCPSDMEPLPKRPKHDGVPRKGEKKCGCAPCLCGRPPPDTGADAPAQLLTLRTHEVLPGGWVRERAKRGGAVVVDPCSGSVVAAPPQPRGAVGVDGKAARAAHNPLRLCPRRWCVAPGGLLLLDGSLAATCKAMAAAGVADATVDATFMPSSLAAEAHAASLATHHHASYQAPASAATPHVAFGGGRGEILTPATAALLAYDDSYDDEDE